MENTEYDHGFSTYFTSRGDTDVVTTNQSVYEMKDGSFVLRLTIYDTTNSTFTLKWNLS